MVRSFEFDGSLLRVSSNWMNEMEKKTMQNADQWHQQQLIQFDSDLPNVRSRLTCWLLAYGSFIVHIGMSIITEAFAFLLREIIIVVWIVIGYMWIATVE